MNEVNFFVAGDIAAIHSEQLRKMEGKVKQASIETTESFSSTLSRNLLDSLFALSKPENGNMDLVGTGSDELLLEDMVQQMDEILSLQLSILNEVQELESKPNRSINTDGIPDGYYELLEDVMAMVNVLTTLDNTTQGETREAFESFARLSERVLMFMKGFLQTKEEKTDQFVLPMKEHKNLKELMSMIETRLGKLLSFEVTQGQNSTSVTENSPKRPAYASIPEAVLQNGPVTMNLLQLPKQTTIQWTIDTTTNEAAREQLLQKLEGILAKTSSRLVNGNQSITIRLAPEHLGTLHIKLQETQHGLMAKLIVHSKAAASLLESGLSNLKQALVHSNVNMEKLEIVYQDQEQKFTQQNKDNNEDSSHTRHFSKKDSNDGDNNQSFEDVLLEELEIKNAVGDGE
jgi:hypothetical protein